MYNGGSGSKAIDYDIHYYDNLLRIHSHTAEKIANIRWNFINGVNPNTVLDYGCGVGWFRAFKPPEVIVDSYDIMPVPQTGVCREKYDLICFWDVIEHIKNLNALDLIVEMGEYIACTVPVFPPGKNLVTWKHFKPGEHLQLFSEGHVEDLFNRWGFRLLKKGQPECPPREDVWNFLFKRR